MIFNLIDSEEKKKFIEYRLKNDTLFFTRFFFKYQYNRKFVVGEHHKIICDVLLKVLKGEITKLIINMPPRYGKTELVVKSFIAQALAINPRAKFIHTSYSQSLVLDNAQSVRDFIAMPEYQFFFNIKTRSDTKSKQKWYTEQGGGMYSTSAGGQITGFGAGLMDDEEVQLNEFASDMERIEGFGGAFIIDDPVKPDDAHSMTKREAVNYRFDSTFRSRVNSKKTPFIIVQQRVHERDLTGYLLEIEPDDWYVLSLPAMKDDGTPLWEFKHNIEDLNKIRKANYYVWETQYQQNCKDIKLGGEFLSSYDIATHEKKVKYNDTIPIHLSFDNNTLPYVTVTIWQIDKDEKQWIIRQIDEIIARDPHNSPYSAALLVVEYLNKLNYKQKIFCHGDKSTKNGNNLDKDKLSAAERFMQTISEGGYAVEDKFYGYAPSVSVIGDFVNNILNQTLTFARIEIGNHCHVSKKDYIVVKKDENGGLLKSKEKDPKTGASYEPHGHCTDTFKDLVISTFSVEFEKFKNRFSYKPKSVSLINRQNDRNLG